MRDRPAAATVGIENRREEIPEFVLGDFAGDFPAADLLVEGIKELLPGRGACESGALEQRAAEPALVSITFGRTVEGNAEPIHQIDDLGTPIAHFLDGGLMLKEIAAVNGVVKMFPLVVALLAGEIVDAVDAALAQTLWERLTGTRLMRSTSMPSSASFIVAARPARPPPTTSTRCLATRGFRVRGSVSREVKYCVLGQRLFGARGCVDGELAVSSFLDI